MRTHTEPSVVPSFVSHEDLCAAVAPLLALLGTDVDRVFDDPGIHIQDRKITLTLAGEVHTDAVERKIMVGNKPHCEPATEVSIPILWTSHP